MLSISLWLFGKDLNSIFALLSHIDDSLRQDGTIHIKCILQALRNKILRICKNYHHVALPARIFLTFSRHPSQSFIDPGRSLRLYPVLALSCYIQVLAGLPAFARPCEVVHRSISLMSSSLILLQFCMFDSSNLDSFRVRGLVAVQPLFCRVLPPGLFNISRSLFCNYRQVSSPYI